MKALSLRERLRESTSTAILDAAEQVAATSGIPAASLQAVADGAGIAVGTIYNYFHDRRELFEALFARRRAELHAAIEAETKRRSGEPFEQQLAAFVRVVFAHFDERRTFLRIALESEQMRPAVVRGNDGKRRPAMHQLHAQAERLVRLGVAERRLRAEGAELYASILVSVLRGVLLERVDDDSALAEQTDFVVRVFLRGAAR
jgi:AcrR family transcriptional regulator